MYTRQLIALSFVALAATGATTGATGTSTGSTGTGYVGSTGTAPAVTTNPPLAGANSFTEAQARERITAAGFSTVGALRKDDSGIWRSTAQKGGKTVNVAVDFKGNIVQTN